MLCAKFGWNWSSRSEEEDENVKGLQTDRLTDGRMDRRRARDDEKKPTWALSSGELNMTLHNKEKDINFHNQETEFHNKENDII